MRTGSEPTDHEDGVVFVDGCVFAAFATTCSGVFWHEALGMGCEMGCFFCQGTHEVDNGA